MEDNLTVAQFKEWFLDAETATQTARKLSERDRDYYDNWQLTDAEIAELRRRGQPPVVINRIQRKVDWLRGLEAQRRTDPRAFPRTPQHEQDAEAATDAIKFVCDKEDFDRIGAQVWECLLVEGMGGAEVVHTETPRGVEVTINLYHWDRLFYDPHSREADFSDARYLGAVVWEDASEMQRRFPKAKAAIDGMVTKASAASDTFDDRPAYVWVDGKRNRMRVVLMHYRVGGEWRWCVFSGEVKIDGGVSPYVDEYGETVCPLIMSSAYVDRENRRYGLVRAMVDVQDEINKRRSKALHLMTQRQTFGDKGAVESVADMKRELARPDGHVEVMPGMRFEPIQNGDMVAGQFQLLQEAKNEIDLFGPNEAMAGEGPASQSGRAVMAKQQGGLIEIAPVLDRFSMWKRAVYRAVWQRVRQFWTEERWIRVTDDERNARFVAINRPVTLTEQLQSMPEDQAVQMAQQMGLMQGDPRLGMVVAMQGDVASLDVDIVLDEVPEAITLQGETFEAMVNLAASGAVPIPPEMLVELAPNLRREQKDKLLERMQQQQAAQAQEQQRIAPIAEAQAVADIEKTESETERNIATALATVAKATQPQAY